MPRHFISSKLAHVGQRCFSADEMSKIYASGLVIVGCLLTLSFLSILGSFDPLHKSTEVKWNDGALDRRGSCFCGDDAYCLCTPSLSVDIVIELEGGAGVCLVQRADNAKFGNGNKVALPGGFVDVGESLTQVNLQP